MKPKKQATKSGVGGQMTCETCDRCVDLEVPPFETLYEAGASHYRFALCIKNEVMQDMTENALAGSQTEWREREECLKARLEEESAVRTPE